MVPGTACAWQRSGVGYDAVRFLGVAKIVIVLFSELVACAKQVGVLCILDHFLADMIFSGGNVGQIVFKIMIKLLKIVALIDNMIIWKYYKIRTVPSRGHM